MIFAFVIDISTSMLKKPPPIESEDKAVIDSESLSLYQTACSLVQSIIANGRRLRPQDTLQVYRGSTKLTDEQLESAVINDHLYNDESYKSFLSMGGLFSAMDKEKLMGPDDVMLVFTDGHSFKADITYYPPCRTRFVVVEKNGELLNSKQIREFTNVAMRVLAPMSDYPYEPYFLHKSTKAKLLTKIVRDLFLPPRYTLWVGYKSQKFQLAQEVRTQPSGNIYVVGFCKQLNLMNAPVLSHHQILPIVKPNEKKLKTKTKKTKPTSFMPKKRKLKIKIKKVRKLKLKKKKKTAKKHKKEKKGVKKEKKAKKDGKKEKKKDKKKKIKKEPKEEKKDKKEARKKEKKEATEVKKEPVVEIKRTRAGTRMAAKEAKSKLEESKPELKMDVDEVFSKTPSRKRKRVKGKKEKKAKKSKKSKKTKKAPKTRKVDKTLLGVMKPALFEEQSIALCRFRSGKYAAITVQEEEDGRLFLFFNMLDHNPNTFQPSFDRLVSYPQPNENGIDLHITEKQSLLASYDGISQSWISAQGINNDVQKLMRLLRKLPDRIPGFYQEVNRFRNYAVLLGMSEMLQELAGSIREEVKEMGSTSQKHGKYIAMWFDKIIDSSSYAEVASLY